MARKPTIVYPNAIYHVMSRGVNKQNLFLSKKDYIIFLGLLKKAFYQLHCVCLSFCLMPNHYHLILQTPAANLPAIMKFINQEYAQYYLAKYENKDGHVFKGRYKKKLVECEQYAKELFRYVHLNPVKAKLVTSPILWEWSSLMPFLENTPNYSFLDKTFYLSIINTNSRKDLQEFFLMGEIQLSEKYLWGKSEIIKPLNYIYLG